MYTVCLWAKQIRFLINNGLFIKFEFLNVRSYFTCRLYFYLTDTAYLDGLGVQRELGHCSKEPAAQGLAGNHQFLHFHIKSYRHVSLSK